MTIVLHMLPGNRGRPEVPTRDPQRPLRRWCHLCQSSAGNAEPEASGNSSGCRSFRNRPEVLESSSAEEEERLSKRAYQVTWPYC